MSTPVPTTTSADPDGFISRRYGVAVETIAEDLEALAKTIRRTGRPATGQGSTVYTSSAVAIHHRVMNALPNMGFGALFDAAATMDVLLAEDRARAEASAAEPEPAPEPAPDAPRFVGSSAKRQSVGRPGHCERCVEVGHVAAHPGLGCGDVGCYVAHGPDDPA